VVLLPSVIMETEQSDGAVSDTPASPYEQNSFRAESIVTLAQLPLRPLMDSIEVIQAYIEQIRGADTVNSNQKITLLGKRQRKDERTRARPEIEDRKIKEARRSLA